MEKEMLQGLLEGGIDIEGIYHRLPGKDDLIIRLLKKFPEEQNYNFLVEAVEEKDYRKAFEAAHNLKGVAANMDMHPLLESMSLLVEKLREEEPGDISAEFEAVKRDYERVIEAINRILRE